MSSHFNAGNVWGIVTKCEEKKSEGKGTPFLNLEIECKNPDQGSVRAWGRMWGKEKIAAFLEHLKAHKNDLVRLKGFYDQYEDRGTRYSSYFFYDFQKVKPEDLPRAAFILVGDLLKKELVDGEALLTLEVVQKRKDIDKASQLAVWLLDVMAFYETEPGDLIEVRGTLRKREAEDFCGGSTDDPIRPYVITTKKRVRKDEE